jgi:hypothetical protein
MHRQAGTLCEGARCSATEPFSQGELAFRPVSYTPWPVEEDYEGERVRIRVGSIAARQLLTFVFSKWVEMF